MQILWKINLLTKLHNNEFSITNSVEHELEIINRNEIKACEKIPCLLKRISVLSEEKNIISKEKSVEECNNIILPIDSDKNEIKFKNIDEILSFIHKNWVMCFYLNRHVEDNIFHYYETRQDIENCTTQTCYSCFFVPGYFGDLFKIEGVDQYHLNFINCTNDFIEQLKPSRFFVIDICNHIFTILFLNYDKIYYIDFYQETDRKNYTRIDVITIDEINEYFYRLKINDYKYIARFNKFAGNGINLIKNQHEGGTYFESAYYKEITYEPVFDDLINIAEFSINYFKTLEEFNSIENKINKDFEFLKAKFKESNLSLPEFNG